MSKSIVYTGKLFKLKNIKNISWATKPNKKIYGNDPEYKSGGIYKTDIPDQVMVIDERAKKVKVYLGKEVNYVWISKYYLGDEIVTGENKESCELLDKTIKQISGILNKNTNRPNNEKLILIEVLKNIREVRKTLE